MVSQHGILLAVNIISDHFGPIVSVSPLPSPPSPLPAVPRTLSLTLASPILSSTESVWLPSAPRRAVVAGYRPPPRTLARAGAGDRTVTLYLAIFDNVLHRLRFSKFLSVVRVDIPESEVLLEGLLQNGRLTFEQLVERTIFKVSEDSPLPTREEVRMNFNKLVYAHYVERCPKPEPFFDPLAVEQPTSTRKRAPKTVEAVLSLEQKVVCTAALSDAERFSEIPYFMDGSSSAKDGHHAVAGNKMCYFVHLLIILSFSQRKHETLEVDEDDSIIAESEVLWRINFERFIFCLKKKFCAERKKAKMRLGTLAIWEAFFEANVTNNDNKTVTSPIDGILERVGQKEGGMSMTLDHITSVLNDLECTSTANNPEEFTFGKDLYCYA
ncbi:RNA polymerase III subunit RPC82 family protein [Zea mays]|uniref:DNA-directed RNA polymerase III subunit RPC3 n=1 Tax=Zea mays TaxID=4577 RepID=A0A1D6NJX3_MAIZE|nr:RNA polymerase III subunit RPC82 family protein [Zea mays]